MVVHVCVNLFVYMCVCVLACAPSSSPDGVGVHHEPDGLSGQFRGPEEAHGSGGGDPAAGGHHLGGLLRAHLRKTLHITVICAVSWVFILIFYTSQ